MEHAADEAPAENAGADALEKVLRRAWQRATAVATAGAVGILIVHGFLAVAVDSPSALRAAVAATGIGLLAPIAMGLFSLQPVLMPRGTHGQRSEGLVDRVHHLQARVRDLEGSTSEGEAFVSSVSHDLKEPLNLIASYLQLFEERHAGNAGLEGLEHIERASQAADRTLDLVDGLLVYTRAGSRAPEFEPVALDRALDDALENLRVRIEETDATIEREPLPHVLGSRSQLSQVFQNLVGNALKFRREGVPPVVEIRAAREGRSWRIDVEDNGTGFDAGETDTIFEVFERGKDTGDLEGSGIGLAVCERIVGAHGGEIEASSTPGEGSVFSVHLPARERRSPAAIRERSRELV